jgi:hypothetical protein
VKYLVCCLLKFVIVCESVLCSGDKAEWVDVLKVVTVCESVLGSGDKAEWAGVVLR